MKKILAGLLFSLVSTLGFAAGPSAPTPTPTPNSPGKHAVALTWTDADPSILSFNVYRGSSAGVCSGNPVPYQTGVTAKGYLDVAVTNGGTYVYAVSAVGTGGESACSGEAQVTVPTPPVPPSNLQANVQ